MESQTNNHLIFLRRRPHFIDSALKDVVWAWMSNICDFSNHERLLNKLIFDTCKEVYWTHYDEEPSEYSKEWAEIESFIEYYITENYADYFKKLYSEMCGNSNLSLDESIKRILREEDYSPAGKEIIPNSIVIHKSNPMFRDKIMEDGLKVMVGECYKIYVGYGIKCKPAIFATNSTNKRAWFDSTYDDDIWEINTEMIPEVKWYKDRHYESRSKHIVTFQDIPKEAITLKYKGTGSGEDNIQESIKRILREESEPLIRLRRRLNVIDELLSYQVKNYYQPDRICSHYVSGEELVEVVMYSVIDHMYWDYFSDIDDNSKGWSSMYQYMEKYIKDNYGDKLKEYYHMNCGN